MLPAVLGAVIGGASSLMGGLLSGFTAHQTNKSNERQVANTNKTNIEIADNANALQRQMQQEKMAFDVDMWNRQNQYNSPAAQRQRLEQAGFNPWLQGVSTGTATSSPTMSTFTPAVATAQPYTADPTMYNNAIGLYANAGAQFANLPLYTEQVKSARLDNEAKSINNKYLESMTLKNLKALDLKNNSFDLDNIAKSLENKWNQETYSSRFEMLQQQIDGMTIQNAMASKNLSFLGQQQKMQVAQITSQLATMAAQRGLTRAQISKLGREMNLIDLNATALGISNRKAEAVFDYEVNQAGWIALQARWDAQRAKTNSGSQSWIQYFQNWNNDLNEKIQKNGGFFHYLWNESFK